MSIQVTTARDVRVGEALTKERKSSAALSEGLVAIVRICDSINLVCDTARGEVGARCSSVIRSFDDGSIKDWTQRLQAERGRCGVSIERRLSAWPTLALDPTRRPYATPIGAGVTNASKRKQHWNIKTRAYGSASRRLRALHSLLDR